MMKCATVYGLRFISNHWKEVRKIRKSFTDEFGTRHYVRGKTEAEIDGKIAVLKYQITNGEHFINSSVKTSVWAQNWLETYKKGKVSDAWLKDMTQMLDNRVVLVIGNQRLKDVKSIQIQSIMNDMAGMSQSYINKMYHIINEMFQTAVDNDLIAKNPATNIKLPKSKPAEERRSLTKHEIDLLLKSLPDHRGNLLCKFMLFCGLRPSEAMALRWSDVDLKNGRVHINKATKKDGTVGGTKSKAGQRTVPIPDLFLEELQKVEHEPFALVCPQTNGKMQTKSSVRKMWTSVKKQMDILNGAEVYRNAIVQTTLNEPLVLYDLRHTYCTRLQEADVPIDVARRLMGHSSIEITSRIYTHESTDVLDNVTKLINQKIKKAL